MSFRILIVLLVLAFSVNPVFCETDLAKVKRLTKLATQAFTNNNLSRGEELLDEALETAGNAVSSEEPASFGEYPHLLNSYMLLLKKKVTIVAKYNELVKKLVKHLERLQK